MLYIRSLGGKQAVSLKAL